MHRLGYHKTTVVWLAAISLLVVMLLLILSSVQEDVLTYDKPVLIVAGYSYLCWQDTRMNPVHLPLLKMLAVAPLLPLNLQFLCLHHGLGQSLGLLVDPLLAQRPPGRNIHAQLARAIQKGGDQRQLKPQYPPSPASFPIYHILTRCWRIFFLWYLKLRLEKIAPALTVSQLRRLLAVMLPLRLLTLEDTLALVTWVQRRNHGAYLSHRKRRETVG